MKTKNYYSRTEINQRDSNEDYHRVFPLGYDLNELPITVLVVADGMGGHEHGEDVSRQAVLKVEDFLKKEVIQVNHPQEGYSLTVENLKRTLLSAVESASSLVRRMVQVNGWRKAGSTIVVAAIWRNKVIAANVGDSPLFHYVASEGEVVRVTQDHSVAGILAQAKLITEEMARYHEKRGQLEFFLGSETMPSPEPVYERTLEPGDLLLLCSDGISGILSLDRIEVILAQTETSLAQKADQLIQAASLAGETDNQTLILWRYEGETTEHARSSSQSSRRVLALPFSTKPSLPPSALEGRAETFQEPRAEQKFEEVNVLSLAVPADDLSTQITSGNRPTPFWTKTRLMILLALVGGIGAAVFVFLALPVRLKFPQSSTTGSSGSPCPSQLSGQAEQSGLTIECFVNDGSVLITRSGDGSQIAWDVKQVVKRSDRECRPAVPSQYQGQQDIEVVPDDRQGVPQQLYTLNSQEDCRRLWTRQMPTDSPGKGWRIPNPFRVLEGSSEANTIGVVLVFNEKGESRAVFKLRSQQTFS